MSSKRRARPIVDASKALTADFSINGPLDPWTKRAESKAKPEPTKRPTAKAIMGRQDRRINTLSKKVRDLTAELADVAARLRFVEYSAKLKPEPKR